MAGSYRNRPYGNTGPMREQITFQDQTTVIDTDGSELTTWSNITTAPTVWARCEPDTVRETIIGERGQTKRTWSVFIRFRADISNKMQILWGSRVLHINGQLNPDERQRYLQLDCEESNLII